MSIIVILHTFLFKGKNLGSVKYFANLVEKEKSFCYLKGKVNLTVTFFLNVRADLILQYSGEIEACERQKAGS